MKSILTSFIVIVIGAMFAIPAYATLGKSSGPYFEVGLGYGAIHSKSGMAASLNLGYKHSDHLALEGGVGLFPDANYYVDGALKLIMPLSIGYTVFAKVGAATNFSGMGVLVGVGADYFFTPAFAGTIQGTSAIRVTHKFSDMYAATLGFRWFMTS